MSRDATGYYSGKARESTPCPRCKAPPGSSCNLIDDSSYADVENSTHWARTEQYLEELRVENRNKNQAPAATTPTRKAADLDAFLERVDFKDHQRQHQLHHSDDFTQDIQRLVNQDLERLRDVLLRWRGVQSELRPSEREATDWAIDLLVPHLQEAMFLLQQVGKQLLITSPSSSPAPTPSPTTTPTD